MTWKVSKDSVYPGVASARAKMSKCHLVEAFCAQQDPPQQERLRLHVTGLRYGITTLSTTWRGCQCIFLMGLVCRGKKQSAARRKTCRTLKAWCTDSRCRTCVCLTSADLQMAGWCGFCRGHGDNRHTTKHASSQTACALAHNTKLDICCQDA